MPLGREVRRLRVEVERAAAAARAGLVLARHPGLQREDEGGDRLPLLEEALTAFRKIACGRLGIAEIQIISAADLAPAEVESLRERFQELTRKQAELEFRVDQQLIGGVIAQIGSTVFDGSVRGQLQRLRERLAAR